MTALVGTAEHYAEFVRLCRKRIEDLGITYDTVDFLCGFPEHYTSKLMCQTDSMSVYSLFTMARALALLPEFHHDEAQLAELSRREAWRKTRRIGKQRRPRLHDKGQAFKIEFKLYPDLLRNAGIKGARARNESLTPYQRKMIARRAAQIRWAK